MEYIARANTKTWRYWDDNTDYDDFYLYPFGTKPMFNHLIRIQWSYRDETNRPCHYENGPNPVSRGPRWSMHCDDGVVYTAPVGSFLPNDFGLHDILGNAAEWVVGDCIRGREIEAALRRGLFKWQHPFIQGDLPEGASTGKCRQAVRGQSWLTGPPNVAARTEGKGAGYRATFIGFRVARELTR